MEKITIENKWVVQDALPPADPPLYFSGFSESEITHSQIAIFERLSSKTRTYKSERAAKAAARLANQHYESPYIKAVLIECEEVEVVEEEKPVLQSNAEKPSELPPLLPVPANEQSGWIALDKLCGMYPQMLRKKRGDVFIYAIADSKDELRALPADERLAWKRYFAECAKFVDNRIVKRRLAEGKDPDGADEWRKDGA